IWSLTETPTQSIIRSIAINEDGKIFAGALDDFGFLDRSKNGKYIFISLLNQLSPDLHKMGNVWFTYVHNNLVYFEAETGLFCWDGQHFKFSQWSNTNAFHKSFFWNNNLYVYEEGVGLMLLKDDKFSMAPEGNFFKTTRIYSALPISREKLLIATRYDGLFLYDGAHVQPMHTQADKYFAENQIYTGLMLPDSSFVIGTRVGGAVIVSREGNIRYMINKKNGLPTNIVLGLTLDRAENLWISLDNGISKYEINNRLSLYDGRNGLDGTPNDIERYDGRLYVTTSSGLYVLRPASFPNQPAHFEKVSQIKVKCWNLLKVDNRMLVTSDQGLFELAGEEVRKVTENPSFNLHSCKADSSSVLVAVNNELQSLNLVSGRWRETGFIKGITLNNISFNETHPGKVWLGTYSQGAALLSFPKKNGAIVYENPSIKFFGPAQGLSEGFMRINTIGNEEIFRVGTASKIFRFDYSTNRFKVDTAFAAKFGLKDKGIFPVSNEDAAGGFLLKSRREGNSKRQLILLSREGKNYTQKRFDISRIFEGVHITSLLEKNVIWQGGNDGISRYEVREPAKAAEPFNTFLNKIILLGDSVFFQGIGGAEQNLSFQHSSSSFRFEFTSTNLVAEETNEFQYKLDGFDDSWSEWTSENIKEYSRLWEGDYTFVVRSRNYAEQIGTTDAFAFVVMPPWYRSIYAYVVYFLGAILFVVGLIRWRSYKLEQEKKALQKEIEHQTLEIRQQNTQLEEQSEELKVNAEQLKELDKMKSNFFVNISHEFRTPLSLILSPLEKFIQEKDAGHIRLTEIERMHRNAKRLQQLINQLLDLAKLESGGMKLNVQEADFIYFLRVLSASFESLAESRNIQFEVDIPSATYEAYFDKDKIETVLYNLLSNAFKFTTDGDRIDFRITLPKEPGDHCVIISVSDTGQGIPASEVDKIFDRFYQVDSSSSRAFEGSGIGLSLVKELVQLMNGSIQVKSDVGTGTTFRVTLTLAKGFGHTKPSLSLDGESTTVENLIKTHEDPQEVKAVLTENTVAPSDELVLLVEDNADLRAYLKENLEDDYQIAVAENGQIGLEKAIELTPDLILSDMMMPVMDGFTLCTKIRLDERTSHIPFILLTARTTIESKLEGLELGADEYMTKPFNIKEIRVRMKNLLEQRKNLRKSFSRELTIQPKNIAVTSVDERFLNHALEIMEAHLADEQFSVERFAEEIGMSRKNLLRKIKALTDQSVNEFIRNFRLKHAAQLIAGKSATISEIAYQVGFNNLSYFSKCFKELFGTLPNEYADKVSGSKSQV
ncbi:MAG TPA: ATP-binding protein, partial [Chryseolinea sp.]|nr:ATP-binding protein [Chryseolinea sp.]